MVFVPIHKHQKAFAKMSHRNQKLTTTQLHLPSSHWMLPLHLPAHSLHMWLWTTITLPTHTVKVPTLYVPAPTVRDLIRLPNDPAIRRGLRRAPAPHGHAVYTAPYPQAVQGEH